MQRAACKASHLYSNASWDLVDAIEEKEFELGKVKKEDLPEELQKMSLEEKKSYLKGKATERERIQGQIKKQNEARKKYVVEEQKKLSKSGGDTLDSAIIKCIREQLSAKNFSTEKVVAENAK